MRAQTRIEVMHEADVADIVKAGVLVKQARLAEQAFCIFVAGFGQ